MNEIYKISKTIGEKELIVETGKLAKQADAAVTVQYGETVVLVTCVMSPEIKENLNFLPLTVDYREKTYAAGKIPGGFFKREGRPTEKEILTARLIDRPIRVLFPEGMFNGLQVMATVLSSDGMVDPDILAVNGASFALTLSSIPFDGPLGCVRVGRINGNFIVNPTYDDLESSDVDLVIAAVRDGIVMMEGSAKELTEEEFQDAIKFAFSNIQDIIDMQNEIKSEKGKQKKDIELKNIPEDFIEQVRQKVLEDIQKSYELSNKEERMQALDGICKKLIEEFVSDDSGISEEDIRTAVKKIESEDIRRKILKENIRFDKRRFEDIRQIQCEVGLLPRTHGSGLFTRGETQSLAVTTLGTGSDEQMVDALEGKSYEKFMLHYNFPPFSVGEVKPVRGPGRREIGHGFLAKKALDYVMPKEEDFPYTVRVVSDILESNGSSSMATVCASSLSLMDAGVPIKSAVAGIAMGLVKNEDKEVILTDITGIEDHFGDMDFKVAGTKEGITALQLDVKIKGVSKELLIDAFKQAKMARINILNEMDTVISKPRESLSSYAPRVSVIKVDTDKIGQIIGPGGKTIKKIIEATGASIDIEDIEGIITIGGDSEDSTEKAVNMIRDLTKEVKAGEIYKGKITRVEKFGAFCEILPGKEGLIHVSELADEYVKNVKDVVKIKDEVKVKVIEIDDLGRINLSLKQVEN